MTRHETSQKGGRKDPAAVGKGSNGAWRWKRWFLLLVVVVCVGIAGVFAPRPFWGTQQTSQEESELEGKDKPLASLKPSLPEPSASPPEPAAVPPEPDAPPPEPDAPPPEPSAQAPELAPAAQFTEEGLKEEGMQVVNRLVEDFPNTADTFGLMGNVYVALGNTSEAIKCWEKCAELDPNSGDSYRCMAEIALRKGEYEKAAALSRKLLEIDPSMPGGHSQLGQALIGLGDPRGAIAALKQDIKISPRASLSCFLLGHTHQQLKEYEKAKEYYKTALQIEPDYTEAYYGLAIVCARLGQKDESTKYREKFKELKAQNWKNLPDPRDQIDHRRFLVLLRRGVASTHTNAGIIYCEHGQTRTAEKHWQRAAILDPKNSECREELASLYEQNGRDREALRVCEQLRQIAPGNAQYHLNTGILYARMNRIDAALSAVKRAIQLDPGNVSYRRVYQQIQKGK